MELKTFIDIDAFTLEVMEEITDLTGAMSTQTARAAYYGMQHTQAKSQCALVGLTLSSVEATLTKNWRQKLLDAAVEEAGDKAPMRVTAEMVKAAVLTDPNYLKWAKLEIEAREIETVCRVAYDAFRTRRDMLISLGQLNRAQMQSNIQIGSAKKNVEGYAERRAARDAERAAAINDQ